MKWFPVSIVVCLLALLVALGALQYVWLGQISEGERARLQKSLESDTARFAEDFNREIQTAYFNFQLDADAFAQTNFSAQFSERFDFWSKKTNYPALIKDFYFIKAENDAPVLLYDKEKRAFTPAETNAALGKLRSKLTDEKNFAPFDEDLPALLMPVHEAEKTTDRIIIRTREISAAAPPISMPKRIGFLVIVLDEAAIENKLLPDLAKKYFSEGESADYKLAVRENASGKVVFQTDSDLTSPRDATAKLFNLSPDNLAFFVGKNVLSSIEGERKQRSVVVSQTLERRESSTASPNESEHKQILNFKVQKAGNETPRVRVLEGQNSDGFWTLSARHASGSLEQFVTQTRRKNLAVGFGILSLLGASILLIFVSAQRARVLAQRQVDFVSSVSHEFRTPLAVIRSAGENLTDGVVASGEQVAQYGALVKREGVKLSQMVEQILEFAGARSGQRKYDLRAADVKTILENALSECRPLTGEKPFTIETDIAENLPQIRADAGAFSQAVQNLIANAVKYSGENFRLKISAKNAGGKIKITVEDKGIGIAPKDLKHIFEPFYRSKSVVDEQIHGNGLGLSLVKQTVEAHGGTISVESEIGRGSKFTINLPKVNLTE